MRYLLDTHLLLWSNYRSSRLSHSAKDYMGKFADELCFSTVNLIEIAIKQCSGKMEFDIDLPGLRRTLLHSGVRELEVTSEHALVLSTLPLIHRDPFDRLLIAQVIAEDMTLLTADRILTSYAANVRYLA